MFKAFKQKTKVALLLFIFTFSLFLPLLDAHAAPVTVVGDVPATAKTFMEKAEKYVLKALKTTVFSALLNVATITTQKLAYDAAMYVSGGAAGRKSLVQSMSFEEYGKSLGEQALGEFVGSLSGPWEKLGLNICSPSPLKKLEFQKDLVANVPKYQVKGGNTAPPAPKCNWTDIKKSYSTLADSLDNFEIDVDLSFDIKEGEIRNFDSAALQGGISDLSKKMTSITESLYGQGMDLSKLWSDPSYIKRMFKINDTEIKTWTPAMQSDVKKNAKNTLDSFYLIIDKKVKILEKQVKVDEDARKEYNDLINSSSRTAAEKKKLLKTTPSALYKSLNDSGGDLAFWISQRTLFSTTAAVSVDIFQNETNLKALIKHKLLDRLVIMELMAEKHLTNSLLKYIFLKDLEAYVKKQGDSLSSFVGFIQPGKNPTSVGMEVQGALAQQASKASSKLDELANNKGFKNVTNIVSGRIKTPATVVEEQFKQQTIKDVAAGKQTSILGAYMNADVGTAILNSALSTFTSTVFNNLMQKVYSGLFKPDQIINSNKVAASLSQSELKKKFSLNVEAEIVSLDYQLNNYNILDEFIVCPEKYETSNNCVIDGDFVQILQSNDYMTIKEALSQNILHADWPLISETSALNNEKYCYRKAYCYDNLQLLRRYRMISVAWELAANICSDERYSDICTDDQPITLGEVVDAFYDCGQDEEHPNSVWCNMIDPTWLLKAPAHQCRLKGYGEDFLTDELPQRQEICVDDVSCIAENDEGSCDAWGYCTKEKNVWHFPLAESCEASEDSCKDFTDSSGEKFSFLKNTLWLTEYNTCNADNVACRWFSKEKYYNGLTGSWDWRDAVNDDNEATDRIYFNGKVESCSAKDEGCSRLLRALPRLGTNLLGNSSFRDNEQNVDGSFSFDAWSSTAGADLYKIPVYEDSVLVNMTSSQAYHGLVLKNPVNILAKTEERYFIYSANVQIPLYLFDVENLIAVDPDDDEENLAVYNMDNLWSLTVEAYKVGNISSSSSYIFDTIGHVSTTELELSEALLTVDQVIDIDLYLRFKTVPDVDRLQLALVALQGEANAVGNQALVSDIQLEEVGEFEILPSMYQEYNTDHIVYLKKAPDYYNCYQSWDKYLSESECHDHLGYWNEEALLCESSPICDNFAPYCNIDEVGCESFTALATDEVFTGVVNPDDYCPESCAGYERLYESGTQFTDGHYVNMITTAAATCTSATLGCEEYTSVSEDGGLENRSYFSYLRSCQLRDEPDCQLFYTWDNPGTGGAKDIQSYYLKSLSNEPVVTLDDSLECDEDIYNSGLNPMCFKFYAVTGGEDIDLSVGDSEYISYHLYDNTITCSDNCKPYRLTKEVTEEQCLGIGQGITDINQFIKKSTIVLENGSEVDSGTCVVSAILGENRTCSAINVGCREYRGNRSNAVFSLVEDSFEDTLDANVWDGGVIIKESVNYNGSSLNNLNSAGGTVIVSPEAMLIKDQMYLLTFWAKTAVASPDRLHIYLSDSDEYFTGEDGITLTDIWQKYTLGPVTVEEDNYEPILEISGLNSGNLFIDNFDLKELSENYYLIADSWDTPVVCDQLPGTSVTVPGYMIGCEAYTDSFDYTHYLKSFTSACRENAVGCELVIDTNDNSEFSEIIYNEKEVKYIGDLIIPLVSSESICETESNVWDNGHCYYDYETSPINKKQCELWGYYWRGIEGDGLCVSESIGDNVTVSDDKLLTLVLDSDYLCSENSVSCSSFGKGVLDSNGDLMECDYGSICEVSAGCTCRLEESNDYICTVKLGAQTCTMDDIYLLDDKLAYDEILCEANADGCDKFTDSNSSEWYFRNPGQRLCEFKEGRIDGQLRTGWFKKGTNDPCYDEGYRPLAGLWNAGQSWDYNIAGIDDLANYDFYVGSCSSAADECTNFIDPVASSQSSQRNYYYIWDDEIDTSSCNGQVDISEGCVLFNNTAKNSLIYSAESSYAKNLENDYNAVSPYMGYEEFRLNPLTSKIHPLYNILGENDENTDVTVNGYLGYTLPDGSVQYMDYEIEGALLEDDGDNFGIGGLLGDLNDLDGNTGFISPSGGGSIFDLNLDFELVSPTVIADTETSVDADLALQYEEVIAGILSENAAQENVNMDNNTNMVIKVRRDRVCAEWLDKGDSQIVYDANQNQREVSTSLVACDELKLGAGSNTQCASPIIKQYPEKLEKDAYTLRGIGWDILDYSGYSVPGMYSLDSYRQVFTNDDKEAVLAVDLKTECDVSSDCGEGDAFSCIDKHCYNLANGKPDFSLEEDDLVSNACRAYPQESSPMAYEKGLGNDLEVGGKNTCYPLTGQCTNAFTNISNEETCRNDIDCGAMEKCVFNQEDENDDCLCDYQKLSYKNSGAVVYANVDDTEIAGQGVCMGGVNNGVFCNSNMDCQVGNRTDFRLFKGDTEFEASTCIYPSDSSKYVGLKGLCIEGRGNGENCLTWFPVERFLGQDDIYENSPKVGLASNKKYYCLKDSINIPVLRQGDNKVMSIPLCPETKFGIDENEYITRTDVATGKMYYIVDIHDAAVGCDEDEYRKNILFTGAIVNVTDEKMNQIGLNWPDGNLDGNSDVWGTSSKFASIHTKLKNIMTQMQSKWQGQSCLYMITDLMTIHPNYFYQAEDYWGNPNYYPDNGGDSKDDSAASYPIVVVCRPEGMIDFESGEETELVTGGVPSDSLKYFGIDPFSFHSSVGQTAKSVETILDEIKDIYVEHDNNCDIAFQTHGNNIGSGSTTQAQVDEGLARELHYLVNTICEYHNIDKVSYLNLYKQNILKRGDDSSNTWTERIAYTMPYGEENVCSVLAEVIDDEGNNKAYTNELSDYSIFDKNLKYLSFDSWADLVDANQFISFVDVKERTCNQLLGSLHEGIIEDEDPDDDNEDNATLDEMVQYWERVANAKRSVINNTLSPYPFGAVKGNNLNQLYRIPDDATVYKSDSPIIVSMSEPYSIYSDIGGIETTIVAEYDVCGEANADGVRTCEKHYTLRCGLNPGDVLTKNKLFDLYEEVYNVKSYKIDQTFMDDNREFSSVFALKSNAKYSDIDLTNVADPVYADHYFSDQEDCFSGVTCPIPTVVGPNWIMESYAMEKEDDVYIGTLHNAFGNPMKKDLAAPQLVFKNTENVDGIFTRTGGEVHEVRYDFDYNESILDNDQYQLDFYAEADRNAMPIKNITVNWGDGDIDRYEDYRFMNRLPVCKTAGSTILQYNSELEMDGILYEYPYTAPLAVHDSVRLSNITIDVDELNKDLGSEWGQGIAADPENCVEAPFTFKHWYTGVKGVDIDGNVVCNKGTAVDEDGNPSINSEDMLNCILEASVSITDNFGNTTEHPFNLYVPLRYQAMPFAPLFMYGGSSGVSAADLEALVTDPQAAFEGIWEQNAAVQYTGTETGTSSTIGGFGGISPIPLFLVNP